MTGPAIRRDSGKNRDIEVLRALAISCVIVHHWVPHFLARFGSMADALQNHTALWSGVDLFFCISGYVIARSTLADPDAGRGLRDWAVLFWVRRVFRLWPSAWLWAVIPLVLSIVWNGRGGFGPAGFALRDAVMAVLNVANFHYYQCLLADTCGPLGVYWSLSLEEQFYWLFPFLLLLPRRVLVPALIALAAVQIVLPRPNRVGWDPSLLWMVRTDAICLGVLLALLERPAKLADLPWFVRSAPRARLVTLILVAILVTAAAPALYFPLATGLIALVSAGLVWMARFDRALILPRTPLDPLVMWIGSRSYSLYLIHATAGRAASVLRDQIVGMAPTLNPRLGVGLGLLLTIGLTVLLSELNFRFLEVPLRSVGRRISKSLKRRQGHEPVAGLSQKHDSDPRAALGRVA